MMATVACDAPRQGAADGGAPRPARSQRGARRYPSGETARSLLLDAMTVLARELGRDRVSTSRLYRHAGLGRRVFESEFASIEECFEEAVEAALEQLLASVNGAADGAGAEWADRVSAAVVGFLRFLDERPAHAWMSIVEPLSGGDRARFARRDALERLGVLLGGGRRRRSRAIDRGPEPRPTSPVGCGRWPASTSGTVPAPSTWTMSPGRRSSWRSRRTWDAAPRCATLGRLPPVARESEPRAEGAIDPGSDGAPGALLATVVGSPPTGLPGSGWASRGGDDPLAMIPVLTMLAAETLAYLADHPGAAGVDVSAGIGVGHPSQTSRHLNRLEALDLVWSQRDGRYKRWALTDRGAAVVERLRDR